MNADFLGPQQHADPLTDAVMERLLEAHPAPVTGTQLIRDLHATHSTVFKRLHRLRDSGLVEVKDVPVEPRNAVPYGFTRPGLALARRPLVRCRRYLGPHGWVKLTRTVVAILAAGYANHPDPFTATQVCCADEYDHIEPRTVHYRIRRMREDGLIAPHWVRPRGQRRVGDLAIKGHHLTDEGLRLAELCTKGLELTHFPPR